MSDRPTTTRQCAKCGSTERYASGVCKSCAIARGKAAYASDPDKGKAYTTAYRAAHPGSRSVSDEAYRAANKVKRKIEKAAWHANNLEKVKAYSKSWHEANPMATRVRSHNRRERKKANGGKISHGLAEFLFVQQRGKCPCCKLPLGDDYHMDHKMPLALGGPNTDDNMQLLRAVCNMQKHAAHPVDFMQSRGFLL